MASHTDIIRKFDTIIQSMRAGWVNNPIDYIEQISYFLFLKLLDEREQQAEQIAKLTNKTYDGVFSGNSEKYRFRNWAHSLNGDELRLFIESDIFPFIRNLKSLRPEEREYFRNAHLKIYEPSTLKGVVENIASMDFSSLDTIDKGDLYEHMLSQISKSWKNGQFRTPRHIIDMMTSIVDPDIMETVYDPSVGTAWFIISAFQHILKKYSDPATMKHKTDDRGVDYTLWTGDKLTETQSSFLYQKTFYGYDIDAHMVRFSIMNMILHGFTEGTNIRIKDTLGKNTDEQDKARQYDIILANPPFSGTIDRSRIDSDDFPVASNSTEVLFLGHMIDKLRDGGRAAVIVPEWVLFKTNNDYQAIRKYLMNKCTLQAVISLPSWVFNPYSWVKTNILVFQKWGKTDKVWFYDMHTDGYDLGAQRRPNKETDIPDILHRWKQIKQSEQPENDRSWCATKEEIEKNEWVLSANQYKKKAISNNTQLFDLVKLGDLCDLIRWISYSSKDKWDEGNGVPMYNLKCIKKDNKKLTDKDFKYYTGEINERHWVKEGDLMIALTDLTPTSEIIWKPVRSNLLTACYSADLAKVKVKPSFTWKIILDYLYYILSSEKYHDFAKLYSSWANVKHLSSKWIINYEVPLPPLNVQQELVNKLNAQQAIIDSIDTLIHQLEEAGIDESLFDGIDEWVELGEVCDFKRWPFGSALKKEFFVEKWYKIYEQKHAIKNDFTIGTYFIDEKKFGELQWFELLPDDIIISCSWTIWKIAIAPKGLEKWIINQALLRLRPKEDIILSSYLSFCLSISQVREKMFDNAAWAGIKNVVGVAVLKKVKIPLARIEHQKIIVEKVAMQNNALWALKLLKDEKKSSMDTILQSIFS
jgi:type I restriction enzyme M protein